MASGSCSVWLEPHLLTAEVELWYKSYGADLYTGLFVRPGWQNPDEPWIDPYYIPGDPFSALDSYTVKFPRQQIDGIWYEATELGFNFNFGSDWTYTIPLTEEEPPVDTLLTLGGPASVYVGQDFDVYGSLQRADTMAAMPSMPVDIYVDGAYIGSTTTDTLGAYLYTLNILVLGSHLVEAVFPGVTV